MERISRKEMFSQILSVVEKRSVCTRLKVAALIEVEGRILALGYNGPPSGIDHCCQEGDERCTGSVHAEMNAIAFCSKNGISTRGATLYVSSSPCLNCAKVIINSGIVKVVYRENFRDPSGVEFLKGFMEVRPFETQ